MEILKRNIISDLEKNLVERKTKWELQQIDSMKEFAELLGKSTCSKTLPERSSGAKILMTNQAAI